MVTKFHNRIRKNLPAIAFVWMVFSFIFGVIDPSAICAQGKETLSEALPKPATQLSQGPLQQINKYFSTQTIIYGDGKRLKRSKINGPPVPPSGYELERAAVVLPKPGKVMGINTLTVPAFDWFFGCSATSAAMIAGYYDRNGFANMYTGPTNGGVIPLDSSSWPNWADGYGGTYGQCPLTASHNGLDGRATRGSIDDYWIEFLGDSPDPYITNGWTQHAWGEAIGDFMKTSQSDYNNIDGTTSFYNYESSADPLTCSDMEEYEVHTLDGTYGRKLFYEARGYTVTECYSQNTDNTVTGGFSFAQYKAEIDAGRPVMLNLEGHSIVGVGYDDSTNTIYIHDTWDYSTYTMTWGSTYHGMLLLSVGIVNLQTIPLVTAPTATTNAAGGITTSGATLNGTVNPNNGSTTVTFQYGLTTAYGTTVTADQSPVTGNSDTAVSKAITGLNENTTYHYQVVGVNSAGTTHGGDLTFITLADATPPLLNITSHSNGQHGTTAIITLSGTSSDSGKGDNGIQQVTVNGVRAGGDTATGSGTANWSKSVGLSGGANSITVTAYDNSSNHNSTTISLTIYYDVAQAPTVTSGLATKVTPDSATLNGTVHPNGLSTTYFFEWGPTTTYGNVTGSQSAGSGWDNVTVSANLTGLTPLVNYHYRLVAANSLGISNGSDMSFIASVKTLPWLMLLLGH